MRAFEVLIPTFTSPIRKLAINVTVQCEITDVKIKSCALLRRF